VILFRGLTNAGPIVLGALALPIWRMRESRRVAAPPAPLGAVLVDREPPPDPERDRPPRPAAPPDR